jgi:hypothetical protein
MVTIIDQDMDESPNGDGTEYAEERGKKRPDYEDLFGAPDFTTFIKKPVSARSREYQRKVQSMMKSAVIGAVNMQDYPDAATFLKYGPAFARASGELADSNAKTREIIDMLTAPDSPVLVFAAAAIPMVAQLWRNHEPTVEHIVDNVKKTRRQRREAKRNGVRIPKPEAREVANLKILGRRIPIKIRLPKVKFSIVGRVLHARAQHPQVLVNEVFSDPKVVKALRDIGAFPEAPEDDNAPDSAQEES